MYLVVAQYERNVLFYFMLRLFERVVTGFQFSLISTDLSRKALEDEGCVGEKEFSLVLVYFLKRWHF